MKLTGNFGIALNGLRSNKLRSLLTVLGIVIGVAAVIMMIAVGQGARKSITSRIESMGSNLLLVFPEFSRGAVRGAAGSVNSLTREDADAIAGLPFVKCVAPELSGNATLRYEGQTWTAQVSGTTPDMQYIKDWTPAEGTFFSARDLEENALVAVIGSTVAENLFPAGVSPLGRTIGVNRLTFTVVGVLPAKGASMGGQEQDNVVYIPISTAQVRLLGANNVRVINVQAESQESMAFLQNMIANLLRQRHRIPADGNDDFVIRNLAEVLATAEDITRIMTILLASVAGVSLLVGGIGIMNIMLVSVTERTREIGIRMAVGATERAIMTQFLVEAVTLCLLGGAIGIILGLLGSRIISALAGWPTAVSLFSVLLAAGFSAAVGIFFGYYPARKAASLNPIDALRFE
ncbi:MAG: ABC transporter permease [Peptococcaceae bacterium]|nr:ABC transporter permease [Peptococcaceae bacterium]